MEKEIYVWKPIIFDKKWLQLSTTILDNILPSWEKKRELLKENEKDYEKFLNCIKRKHAIETGIVEKLYDLKEGITETFIKEGFVKSYLQHGDTNIQKNELIDYLKDHFNAIDYIFDFVKNNRRISKSYILELHQLVTSHQDTTQAIDQQGNYVQVKLLKGRFKTLSNNPKREDGTRFMYCPPEQVESEMDNLLNIYLELENDKINPVIKAAFFHHVFTQIHPFQDGNGRIARLLSSFILIKENLFPLTIERKEKKEYIDSLENADNGSYQGIVDLFCKIQI